jgi:hypothetical protein
MMKALPSAIVQAPALTGARISAPARIDPSQNSATAATPSRGPVQRPRPATTSTASPASVAAAIGRALVRI